MAQQACPVEGCPNVRDAIAVHFCAAHWHMIPEKVRGELWHAYRYAGPISDAFATALVACHDAIVAATTTSKDDFA